MAAGRKRSRNPNQLTAEEAEPFRLLLEERYQKADSNGAAVGRELGISGSAVSQLLSRRTRLSLDTCRRIAAKLGSGLSLGITGGHAPDEGMRTIGSDPTSMAALEHAAREYELSPWVVAALARTSIPEAWPSLTPAVCHDLAAVWLKWEGKLGSRVRPKALVGPQG
jgi:transcriptional regulator with XRE-family HTH domain